MRGGKKNMVIKFMDNLLYKLLFVQMRSCGIFEEEPFYIGDVMENSGLPSFYKLWLSETVNLLTTNNFLNKNGDKYSPVKHLQSDSVWLEWEHDKAEWSMKLGSQAYANLVEKCLKSLPDILGNRIKATDILFPDSSIEMVEGIYKGNTVSDHFNEILTDCVIDIVRQLTVKDHDVKIRILEIGAGTGGTSSMLFEKLAGYERNIGEYCYTDISKAFLMHAEDRYRSIAPYLNPKIFNVELPLAEQGIDEGIYDIAIATNALHATKDIRNTLRNSKAVLKKNGILLLNELSDKSLFAHLTFGLLEGWWLSKDIDLRMEGSPVLRPDTWRTILSEEGFDEVVFPAEGSHEMGQQVIAAESDGIVRQIKNRDYVNKKSRKAVDIQEVIAGDTENDNLTVKSYPPVDFTDQMLDDFVRLSIREILSDSLQMEQGQIRDDLSFSDYGVDSIVSVQLINRINRKFGIQLQTTAVFDYGTVDRLTEFIIQEYGASVECMLMKKLPVGGKNTADSESINKIDINRKNDPVLNGKRHRIYSQRKKIDVQTITNIQHVQNADILKMTGFQTSNEPIAIIGMSGRFGKSESVEDLWMHLAKGDDLVIKVSRWNLDGHYGGSDDQTYCNSGSFLNDIGRFDPVFFNISGIEAAYMDPQQRLFLEESWKALEDAGYAGDVLEEKLCGVYVGYSGGDYRSLFDENSPPQALWGNTGAIIPARISYYLNLHGPAVTVDTACSSSLVAVHLACQALWNKEIDIALAGGVFLQSTPQFYIAANKAGMLSPTGRCYVFDERADGFVPGEGVGVVVLKRLSEAVTGRDHIYGIIKGSGLNQDGRTNGITAPSALSQERLETQVYEKFRIDPGQIQMVEAHGTGTKLGDPIEYQSLVRAFERYTDRKEYCAIGSIKSNLGHTVAAAGVAGLIKILLSLEHGQIPASLNYQIGNPEINFKDSPFFVNTELKEWSVKDGEKRRAAISSFSISGTNAHMVIEEAPVSVYIPAKKPGYLVTLSAHTAEQLRLQAERLADFCEINGEIDCLNMSFTLLVGRKHFNHRLGCVARNVSELVQSLRRWMQSGKLSQVFVNEIKEHREQTALKNYGNQCIKELANETDSIKYLERLSGIAELYIQGYRLDYVDLFTGDECRRISLPTYPFVGERYWAIDDGDVTEKRDRNSFPDRLHPLLHRNTSDLEEQRFTSLFTGDESLFIDGPDGSKILPGYSFLEMAIAAIRFSLPEGKKIKEDRGGIIMLEDIVWAQPFVINYGSKEINIALFPDTSESTGDLRISFEIYGGESDLSEGFVYFQGGGRITTDTEDRILNIEEIKKRCSRTMTGRECYDYLSESGFICGGSQRCIKKLYAGNDQVLAFLEIDDKSTVANDGYFLNTEIMNDALRSSIMLASRGKFWLACTDPSLPASIKKIEVISSIKAKMWVVASFSGDQGDVPALDLDICDEDGMLCVAMNGIVYPNQRKENGGICDAPRENHSNMPKKISLFNDAELKNKKYESGNHDAGMQDFVKGKISLAENKDDDIKAEDILAKPKITLDNL